MLRKSTTVLIAGLLVAGALTACGGDKNNAGEGNHWLGLKLQGTSCNRDAIGAKITWTVGGKARRRLKTSGGSYLSSHDPREILGVGSAGKIDSVEIRWPSGLIDKLTNVPINKYIKVVERAAQNR